MPTSVENYSSYRQFVGAPDTAEQPARPARLASAARFCRDNAPYIALQRLVGGNVPLQGLIAAVQTPEGAQRGVTEALAGLMKSESLVAYGIKDGVCFLAERNLGGTAIWLTRMPRWVARTLACAVVAPLQGLAWSDVKPWLGRPDYGYPERCAELPRPGDCPSHIPGDYADWLEPALAAAMVGTVAYYAIPRLAYMLHSMRCPAAEPRADEENQLGSVGSGVDALPLSTDAATSRRAESTGSSPAASPRSAQSQVFEGPENLEPLLGEGPGAP